MATRDQVSALRSRVSSQIVGQADVVETLIVGLLADGHLLLEGLPGLAKTRAVKSLARHLAAEMSRIQFTPDLLPSDVTGTIVYDDRASAEDRFRFEEGPIFANLVLVDEINRAPAKVQAALLEAMEERQVTVGGRTHALPKPFMVMATQNPIEQEGTYPLPEAQLDRFLMHVFVDYPDRSAEAEILRLVRGEEKHAAGAPDERLPLEVIFAAREEIRGVGLSKNVEQYLVDLILATRPPRELDEKLAQWIEVGASPRATIALDKCARARAWLSGRDHVTPDDIRSVAHGVLRHRLLLRYEANAEGISTNDVVDRLLDVVAIAG